MAIQFLEFGEFVRAYQPLFMLVINFLFFCRTAAHYHMCRIGLERIG